MSPDNIQRLLIALTLVHAELWGQHKALLHIIGQKLDLSGELLEREVAAWIESRSDDLALEQSDRLRRLLRDAGLSDYVL